MKVWVSRSTVSNLSGRVVLWKQMPKKRKLSHGFYWGGRVGDTVPAKMSKVDFKRLFGFTPRKGSCKQMELTLTEINNGTD